MKIRIKAIGILALVLAVAVFLGYRAVAAARRDSTPPQIHLEAGMLEVSVKDGSEALLQGVTATDNRDGDVTASVVVEGVELLDGSGRISVRYAAFDSAGNVTKATREGAYTDYQRPRFTLQTPLLYRYGSTFDVLSTVGAEDMLEGDIQHRVRATSLGQESITLLGSHDVRFQVTNAFGDTVTLVLPVEVYDPQQYSATVTLNRYLIYLEPGEAFAPEKYLGVFTLMGTDTNLRGGLPKGFELRTTGTVDTSKPGVYPVEYRVVYREKNGVSAAEREYTAYTKLIVVVEG